MCMWFGVGMALGSRVHGTQSLILGHRKQKKKVLLLEGGSQGSLCTQTLWIMVSSLFVLGTCQYSKGLILVLHTATSNTSFYIHILIEDHHMFTQASVIHYTTGYGIF